MAPPDLHRKATSIGMGLGHFAEINSPASTIGTVNIALTANSVRLNSDELLYLEVHEDLAEIEADYTALRAASFRTLFNAPIWLKTYIETNRDIERPCIVVARNSEGRIALVWPMSLQRQFGADVLGWLGQSVFAVNVGCYRPDIAANLTRRDLLTILETLRTCGVRFDAVHLLNQPDIWNGVSNPMLALGKQAAPNGNYERPLDPNYPTLYKSVFSSRARRNHARQTRRLAEFGEIDIVHARTNDERLEILDTFFTFKTAQLNLIGAANPFQSENIRQFYKSALSSIAHDGGEPVHAGLKLNGAWVATLIGVLDGNRFTTLMSAITLDDVAKTSPGQQLLEQVIQSLCERDVEIFDFGPGPSPQKLRWNMTACPLYNSYLAIAPHGKPITWFASGRSRIMQHLKNNERAYHFLSQARARVIGRQNYD